MCHGRIPCTFVSNAGSIHSCVPILSEHIFIKVVEYKSSVLFGNFFEAHFVNLGIGTYTKTHCCSDQRCNELHG